jgi:Tfp pilus assembly protein PilF
MQPKDPRAMTHRSFLHKLCMTAAGIAGLTGCQNLENAAHRGRFSSQANDPKTGVSRAQEADMQIALGRVAERRGAFDEAMFAYKEALKRDKHRADAYQRLAILYDRQADFHQSADMYKMALAIDPGNADIFCDMGYSLFLQRRWAESEQNLKQAIAIQPSHARAHNNLGLVLASNHRDEEALAEYRKAGNTDAEAHANLAVIMTLAGRLDDARNQYQKILAADASSPTAKSRLKELDTLVASVKTRSSSALKDPNLVPVSATASRPSK